MMQANAGLPVPWSEDTDDVVSQTSPKAAGAVIVTIMLHEAPTSSDPPVRLAPVDVTVNVLEAPHGEDGAGMGAVAVKPVGKTSEKASPVKATVP